MTTQDENVKMGPVAAALIAGGIGSTMLGLMTTGAVISSGLKTFLNLWDPAGPLTGKTTMAVLTWLISWAFLNSKLKDKDYDLDKAFKTTLILIGIGVFFTFPLVFDYFHQ